MTERDLRVFSRSRTNLQAQCDVQLKSSNTLLKNPHATHAELLKEFHLHKQCLADLRQLNADILALTDDSKIDSEADQAFKNEFTLKRRIAELQTAIDLVEMTTSASATPQTSPSLGHSQEVKLGSVKLPKLEIEKFSGDALQYQQFWDLFESTIDSNEHLSDIDKLKYLISYLDGDAKRVAQGYSLTRANYKAVCEALKERFGRPQLAIFSHLCTMISLSVVESHDARKLQSVFDEFECHIRSLVALGLPETTFGQVFTAVLLCKLPKFVRMELHRKIGSADWTLDTLRSLLRDEIRAREMSETNFVRTPGASSDVIERKGPDKIGHKGKYKQPTASVLTAADANAKGFKSRPHGGCRFCDQNHSSEGCTKFADARARRRKVQGSCFVCFRTNHLWKACRVKYKCKHCQGRHHESLCYVGHPAPDFPTSRKTDSVGVGSGSDGTEFVPVNNTVTHSSYTSLQTALVFVTNCVGAKRETARLLFDTGGSRSYVTRDLAQRLGASPIDEEVVSSAGFGENRRKTQTFAVVEFDVCLLDGSKERVRASVTPVITCPVEKQRIDLARYPFVSQFPLAEPPVASPSMLPIDILIGNDFYYAFMNGPFVRYTDGMVFIPSKVGYLTAGISPAAPSTQPHQLCNLLIPSLQDTSFHLERFWQLEDLGISDNQTTTEEEIALQHFTSNISRSSNGRYQVRWPWRDRIHNLPDNRMLAKGRLVSLLKRTKGPVLRKYHEIIMDQLSKGVIEPAPERPSGPVIHYIPHHGVVTPDKKTTKLRVVYDASAKSHRNSPSLNECMFKGPLILADLVGILLRARLFPVIMVADIEKAFLQIELKPLDRDTTRFFWIRDTGLPPYQTNLVVYRFARVLFGATASPFMLSATVRHHVQQYGKFKETAEMIEKNRFVDNVVFGCRTDEEAALRYNEAKQIFADAKMNLREWYTNRKSVQTKFADGDKCNDGETGMLGLVWNPRLDSLSCTKLKIGDNPATKRVILREISLLFDPCGCFCPISIRGKVMIQNLWKQNVGWDDRLSVEIQQKWEKIRADLSIIHTLKQHRYIGFDHKALSENIQMHCFADASEDAYAAVVFLRHSQNGRISSHNVFAKARVAPLKAHLTVPRLELMAVLVGTRCIKFVRNQLPWCVPQVFLWSDSQCVLSWLQKEPVSTVFVANRLKEIRSHDDVSFRYVPSECNPADIASRGLQLKRLQTSTLWWLGPDWLVRNPEHWPSAFSDRKVSALDPGAAPVQPALPSQLVAPDMSSSLVTSIVERSSSLVRLRRVVAWIFRFVHNCRTSLTHVKKGGALLASDIALATVWLDHEVQQGYQLSQKFRDSRDPNQLRLFTDDDGLVRTRTRLQFLDIPEMSVTPKLLPKNSPYTDLAIKDCHERLHHAGTSATLAEVRKEYWIPSGRSRTKRILQNCLQCRKVKGGSFAAPQFPPLPDFRGLPARPFSVVGVDYLGPLFISGETGQTKVWLCLFTCAVVRAVHIEVVPDLTANQFLLAIRRFSALRTCPRIIISDNAKNFAASYKFLDKTWNTVSSSTSVTEFSASRGIEWKFVTERAPWMGGFYERMIGMTKNCLKTCLGKARVNLVELQTIAYEIGSTLNKRPLLPLDSDSCATLAPANFLAQEWLGLPECTGEVEKEFPVQSDRLILGWKRIGSILERFWRMWRYQYLANLHEQKKAFCDRNRVLRKPVIGEVVHIRENSPRSTWPLGRIKDLVASADGECRSAVVQMANGRTWKRPVRLLIPLEFDVEPPPAHSTIDPVSKLKIARTVLAPDPDTLRLRPQRNAARFAREKIRQVAEEEAESS